MAFTPTPTDRLTVSGSAITGNNGEGTHFYYSTYLNLSHNTISSNTSGYAINLYQSDHYATLADNTIAGNYAGIYLRCGQ